MSMDHFYDMDIACAIPRESADDTPQVASFRHVATTAIDQMFLTHGIRLIGMPYLLTTTLLRSEKERDNDVQS